MKKNFTAVFATVATALVLTIPVSYNFVAQGETVPQQILSYRANN